MALFGLLITSCGAEQPVSVDSIESGEATEQTPVSATTDEPAIAQQVTDTSSAIETTTSDPADGEVDATIDPDDEATETETDNMVCEYDPTNGGSNPFGMRTFLRFEDRQLGGSAMVFESFGNAVGDGSFWWQSLFAENAASVYGDVLAGNLPIEEFFDLDGGSTAEIEAAFGCRPIEEDLPAVVDYPRPEIPTSGPQCLFDPELGGSRLGLRSTLSVYEISDGSSPIGSGVLYENFGNAAGDGAGYRLDVFLDASPEEALDTYLGAPAYYSQAIGYPEETELSDLIEQIKVSHPCTDG